jgi:hypothetical protein
MGQAILQRKQGRVVRKGQTDPDMPSQTGRPAQGDPDQGCGKQDSAVLPRNALGERVEQSGLRT